MADMPERIWLERRYRRYRVWVQADANFSLRTPYVRQDIADERVREAWDAAIRMAIQIVMERGEVLHRRNLIVALEAARNAAEGESE